MRARTGFQASPLPKEDAQQLIADLEDHFQRLTYALDGVDRDKVTLATTPATAASPGTPGQLAYDSDYIYVCVTTDTWKRAALSTW